ncbi:hypothetical protein [Thiomicrorhabdus xiamenensis]|uniref:LTXXQ motif family protein n=1 Tax=Thiomicrorhabdus xiamenensis TaxID=2739063 RepID=A0A7D4NSD3_9GAMM|nr:hypothetical protein [Thiomicrorhabdus xiamenensis]QKI89857.1 hypothetical protein HQN79_09855 [Thiomicrorhabdus xiamenensis]
MKKVASIIGIVALSGITTLAFAGNGDFCQNKGMYKGEGSYGHSQCMKHKHNRLQDAARKGCYGGGMQKGHFQNKAMSAEKREALMQLKVENRIERMTQKLDLSKQQQDAIRKVLMQKQQNMQQMRQQTRQQVHKLLTDEQRAKLPQRAFGPAA